MIAPESSLFEIAPSPVEFAEGGRIKLRDYQHEDIAHILGAWESGKRSVLCRHATGLGKSVAIAELARVRSQTGRVLVTVDVGTLATDLAQTISRHTGMQVGMLGGGIKEGVTTSPILVSTIQTLYAGDENREWYRSLDPDRFGTVLVDECESSLAERYSQVLWHFRNGNESVRFAGLTATPCRGDGRGMGEFYDYAINESGPLNRDILWARDMGWLVNVKQAFVQVSLDFSTLKLRKDDEGVMDYAESDLTAMLESEQSLRELAIGIDHVAKGEASIVICPNSVELAKALSGHLHAVRSGSAEVVYGEQGRRADDLLASYKKGNFPYIVSVNKLYKGFDADRVKFVFMCRKTRSRRLYEQALGRGTRPLAIIRDAMGAASSPEERRAIIAASAKPHMVMVDMVGVHPDAKDMGVIDILGEKLPEPVRERAKKAMVDEENITEEIETEAVAMDAEKQIAEETRLREESEKRKRRLVQVQGHVSVEETSDISASGGTRNVSGPKDPPSENQIRLLVALGVNPATARNYRKRQAGSVIDSLKKRGRQPDWSLCRSDSRGSLIAPPSTPRPQSASSSRATSAQQTLLSRAGFSQQQIAAMDFHTAVKALDAKHAEVAA